MGPRSIFFVGFLFVRFFGEVFREGTKDGFCGMIRARPRASSPETFDVLARSILSGFLGLGRGGLEKKGSALFFQPSLSKAEKRKRVVFSPLLKLRSGVSRVTKGVYPMSLLGALNTSMIGLRLLQADVKLTSDNVARANDPTRTRHTLERTADRNGTPMISGYHREIDVALRSSVNDMVGRDAASATMDKYMSQVGDLMGISNDSPGLTDKVQKFTEAWRDYDTSPESDVARKQVLVAGRGLTDEMRRLSNGVESLDTEIRDETYQVVDDLNRKLKDLSQLNSDIVSSSQYTDVPQDLGDKRDALIKDIAGIIGGRSVEGPEGRVNLFTSSGIALVNTAPVQFHYDGTNLTFRVEGEPLERSAMGHVREGSLKALLDMRADSSTLSPPREVSPEPGVEMIRKLRAQLDAVAGAFTDHGKSGEPATFADAYDAAPTEDGELTQQFFTGSSRVDFELNANLDSGQADIKIAAIHETSVALSVNGRTFENLDMSLRDVSYSGLASGLIGNWASSAKIVSDTAKQAANNRETLESRYTSQTGVNIDEEIAHLQTLQTSYQAAARVVQAVNEMFSTLERALS
ncbi:flagellar hook-associated protein 1 FlgK [Azospirillaceae bacterium]